MTAFRVLLNVIILEIVFMKRGLCEEYVIGFNDGFSSCKNFENEIFKGDNMQLGKASADGDEAMFLQGYVELVEPVKEGYFLEIEIDKETAVGSEPMWSCSMNVCQSLDDEDAPWTAAIQSMNIRGCPIETGEYYCKNFTLDMSFMKDKLSYEFVGSYDVMLKLKDEKMDTLSCHKLGLTIDDVEDGIELKNV